MKKQSLPDTAPVTASLAEAAAWLRRHGVVEAAVLRASLPEALGFVHCTRVEDLATLKRQANAIGAVIATAAEAADVSRLVAQLRRREALRQLLPSAKAGERLCLDIDEALRTEGKSAAPVAKKEDIVPADGPESAAKGSESAPAGEKSGPEQGRNGAWAGPEGSESAPAGEKDGPEKGQNGVWTGPEGSESAPAGEKGGPEKGQNGAWMGPEGSESAPAGEKSGPEQGRNGAWAGPEGSESAPAGEKDGPEKGRNGVWTGPEGAEMSAKAPRKAAASPENGPERPLFLLLIDTLEAVPALADLPGAQPALAVVAPITAEASAVTEALRLAHACATDTLWERHADSPIAAKAKFVLSQSRALLAQGGDATQAASLLLERGHEGGYAFQLGAALSQRYGLPRGEAMMLALPGLQQAMEGTAAEAASLPQLRLRDVPALAARARRPRRVMARSLTEEELARALRRLYVPMEGPARVEALIPRQQAFFDSGTTLEVAFRQAQLKALAQWIDGHEAEIEAALLADLGKCAFEAYETEIMLVKAELRTARRRLPCWQRDRRVRTPLMHWPAACRVVRNPYGRALIMAPWNYPFLLSVDPLIAALAGGNCVILKPSAYAPATSKLLREMASALFDPEYVAVVEGGRAENESLLRQQFDVIFFTGSVAVGKTVMRAAAEHLTPVTLELGGKSPCIVDDTADVALAARRIAWGKLINAGQTCVAPDYVLCSPAMAPRLEKELERAIRRMVGQAPLNNPELCRIVNARHLERLTGLLDGADVAFGGRADAATLKMEPTVVRGARWEDPVMQEEIFGPILPIVPWEGDFDGAIRAIEARPRPLAAYLFTRNKAHEALFLRKLRFGGGCVNDVVCHLATSAMPFGGVGESGMGSYHGKRGFDAFTHEKSIMKKSRRIDVPVRYAPYGEKKLKWLRKL